MQKIERVGALALVFDATPPETKSGTGKGPTGHIVLDRYRIDEQGNVCLTNPGVTITEMEGLIELIKAELDALRMCARVRPVEERMH